MTEARRKSAEIKKQREEELEEHRKAEALQKKKDLLHQRQAEAKKQMDLNVEKYHRGL